jgi:hypothetical protein
MNMLTIVLLAVLVLLVVLYLARRSSRMRRENWD